VSVAPRGISRNFAIFTKMPPPKDAGAKGPMLPLHLLRQLGTETEAGRRRGRVKPEVSRKDRRKAERDQKKQRAAPAPKAPAPKAFTWQPSSVKGGNAPKPVLKSAKRKLEDDKEEEDEDDELGSIILDDDEEEDDEEDGDDDEEGIFSSDEDQDEERATSSPKTAVPKIIKDKLAQDDAEIAELERKLGMKGRKNLPQSFMEDGLGDLLGDLDGEQVDEETQEKRKRKAEADEWLASKRRKAAGAKEMKKRTGRGLEESDEDIDSFDEGLDDSDEGFLDSDGASGADFDRFDSEDGDEEEDEPVPKRRVRENPYVAPVTGQQTAKYVPPSLRKETGSDAELLGRIRRQTQGLVNRVTESNLVSIIGDIEKLYRDHPRQHVTSVLVDLVLIQVCESTALPDTLLILNAGFATAAYKVIGMDFGAQLIQEVVERFSGYYEEAKAAAVDLANVPKQTSNLITFLSQLYNFQLLGPNLLFDYIRMLLGNLSELTAELLLRIVRISGPALRQDDPMALKDIVSLIRPAVSKIGEQNLSVRTKFMVDTIYDLKNNKMKTGVGATAIVSEHGTRMKKTLGSLNSRKLKSTEPLRIGLKDIQDSDKKGKWWLVGASWAGPSTAEKAKKDQTAEGEDSDDESLLLVDLSDGGPNIVDLARQQMMNTDVRRSIFVAITSACDYEDAYARITKLRLNKDRQKEMPFVVMQCCGAEQTYNPYYTFVAKKLCSDRRIKWSFQNSLWGLFRRLGESIFGEDADDVDGDEEIELRRVVNNAKMFGTLVADGSLGLGILKCLNLPYLQPKTKAFVEVMLITVLQECQASEGGLEAAISTVFRGVEGVAKLGRGLQWFLRKVVRKTELAGGKAETQKLKTTCKMAEKALEGALMEE